MHRALLMEPRSLLSWMGVLSHVVLARPACGLTANTMHFAALARISCRPARSIFFYYRDHLNIDWKVMRRPHHMQSSCWIKRKDSRGMHWFKLHQSESCPHRGVLNNFRIAYVYIPWIKRNDNSILTSCSNVTPFPRSSAGDIFIRLQHACIFQWLFGHDEIKLDRQLQLE